MTNHIQTTSTLETSVLKSLRSLMPVRELTYDEALTRAELQATRLLELHQTYKAPVPIEMVTELPRIRVERIYDLPTSGSAHWDGGNWVLSINAGEYSLRQKFSVMHEFKHVLDHPTKHLLKVEKGQKLTVDEMHEKIADYFAACVLMPRKLVKDAYCNQRIQGIEALADMFQVSQKAMSFRLGQLGLSMPVERCLPSLSTRTYQPSTDRRARSSLGVQRYYRSLPTPEGVLI